MISQVERQQMLRRTDEWIEDEAREFDCPGCGRHLIALCMIKMGPPLCGLCLTHPGWYAMPALCQMLGDHAEHDSDLITMTVVEVECRTVWFHATLAWLGAQVRINEREIEIEPEQQVLH